MKIIFLRESEMVAINRSVCCYCDCRKMRPVLMGSRITKFIVRNIIHMMYIYIYIYI